MPAAVCGRLASRGRDRRGCEQLGISESPGQGAEVVYGWEGMKRPGQDLPAEESFLAYSSPT